jgi:putative inorganic carbon (hco3(-)) transporter
MIAFGGLLLFFFLDYVRPTSFFPALELLHLNSLVPAGVVGLTLLSRRPRRERPEGEPANIGMVFTLLFMIVASAAFASVTERVFNVFVVVVGYVAICWAMTEQVNTMDRLKNVVTALLLVHVIVAALNPLMFTDPDVRHYVTSGAFLGDGNDFALSVIIVIPLCLFLMTDAKTARTKLLWALALAVCIASVVLTKSRGATVALGCVAAYYWVNSDRKASMLAGTLVVVALIMVFAPPSYFERMSMIADSQEGSAQGRIQAWSSAIRMAIDYPLTGVGAGHFPVAFGTHYRSSEELPWMNAHSIFFQALGELGFPGVAILVALIVRNITANRRLFVQLDRKDGRFASEQRLLYALSASMVGFATGGAFLSALYYPHVYVLAGLLTAARRIIRERAAVDTRQGAAAPPIQLPAVRPDSISVEWLAARGNTASMPRVMQRR